MGNASALKHHMNRADKDAVNLEDNTNVTAKKLCTREGSVCAAKQNKSFCRSIDESFVPEALSWLPKWDDLVQGKITQ